VTYPGERCGVWSHCNVWLTQVEDGLIVMGDIPKMIKKKYDLLDEVLKGDMVGKIDASWLQGWLNNS